MTKLGFEVGGSWITLYNAALTCRVLFGERPGHVYMARQCSFLQIPNGVDGLAMA